MIEIKKYLKDNRENFRKNSCKLSQQIAVHSQYSTSNN